MSIPSAVTPPRRIASGASPGSSLPALHATPGSVGSTGSRQRGSLQASPSPGRVVSDARVIALARATQTADLPLLADPVASAFASSSAASAAASLAPPAISRHHGVGSARALLPLTPEDDPDASLLWFALPMDVDILLDAALHPPHYSYTVTGARRRQASASPRPKLGKRVNVNGRDVAVFRYGPRILAFDARCPHAGGALEAGDIEEFDGITCVCCPVHGFLYDTSSGTSVAPPRTYSIRTYPVRRDDVADVWKIGFPALDEGVFADMDF